jgi:peroxiredoxin
MKKTIGKLLSAAVIIMAAISITSCSNKKFHISGAITQAKDSVLYFENVSLNGPVKLDSVKLGESGEFSFSADATEAPEFYRLRIGNSNINLSIDSTETVTVKAAYPTMVTNYTVDGSKNCTKIKELALMQIDLQAKAQAVADNAQLGIDAINDSIHSLMRVYKTDVERNYIFKEPMKAYAYFALFQYITVSNTNLQIFNPREDPADIKVFGAVATSWDTFYPKSLRGQNLHNIALEGMKNQRIIRNEQANMSIDASKVSTANLIDVPLLDNKGRMRHLTDLKGKVVMLDFHVFATDQSLKRIMMLRELYNKYHAQGFEIYQVSLDPDEHFWKTQTASLPWISVHDPDGMNSQNLVRYNVQSIPTFFLIDKNNVLQKRDSQIKDIDAAIKAML